MDEFAVRILLVQLLHLAWETQTTLQPRLAPALCSSNSLHEAQTFQELLHVGVFQILLNTNIRGGLFSAVCLAPSSVLMRGGAAMWRERKRSGREAKTSGPS